MNPPRIPFSLSFLNQLTQVSESFRIFVIGSIISVYGLVLYELFPQLIFDLDNSLLYFIMPSSLIAGVGIGLPRLMPIIMEKILKKPIIKTAKTGIESTDDIFNELITEDSQQLIQTGTSGME